MTVSPANAIAQTLAHIRQTLPDTVTLIAVTKTVSVEKMRVAYAAGVRDFGESRLQETIDKQALLQDLPDITWHLIGHLQRNKAAKALEHFQWIHSVDSLTLAQRLNSLADGLLLKPSICLQVKLMPDPSKFGWAGAELLADLPALNECSNLNIVGLMTIAPYGLASAVTQSVFNQTRDLSDQIRQQQWSNIQMRHLSMGMSDDYPLAIESGATMIRLGRVLFGDRN